MNFFYHKDLGNHLLQLCPKVVKHSVYVHSLIYLHNIWCIYYTVYINQSHYKPGVGQRVPGS